MEKIKKSELKMEIEDLKEEVSNLRETLQYLIDETKKVTIVHPPIWAADLGTVIGKSTIEAEAEQPHRDVLGSPFQKPEFTKPPEQPKFEVGKVYKLYLAMFYCTKIKDGKPYGFGFDYFGNWCEEDGIPFSGNLVEATPEEWIKRLEEEAKKRGFVKGVIVNGKEIEGTFFNIFEDELCSYQKGSKEDSVIIMKDGKWAEIIEEPQRMTVEQRDELAKPFNPDEYQVGTLGAFWDGDWDNAVDETSIITARLDKIVLGAYKPINRATCFQNFKPLKFD